ncbi:zf-HC2 domain-containing protein [Streptomyces sp. NPDC087440]|uniref:zf-HC2 domain-containing protein n=1 Tax=Streptomyces sp. NPDC087440 TaxID=3365790 RepID=UPI00382B29AA
MSTHGKNPAWHVPPDLAARYAAGTAPDPEAWSLEKHVEACGTCAGRVSEAVRAGAAGPELALQREALLNLVGGPAAATPPAPSPARHRTAPAPAPASALAPAPVPAPAPPRVRPTAAPLRVRRLLWTFGPALRVGWVLAVFAVGVGAVALAYGGGQDLARPLLLAVAPLVPLAGVALSYGRHADPVHELHASTPGGGLRLLLLRTACTLGVSVPLLTATGAALPAVPGVPGAAAWLLPGLALTLLTLALGSWVGFRAASAIVGGGWVLAVTAPSLGSAALHQPPDYATPYLDGLARQAGWALAALLCAGLVAVRRTVFDRMERM